MAVVHPNEDDVSSFRMSNRIDVVVVVMNDWCHFNKFDDAISHSKRPSNSFDFILITCFNITDPLIEESLEKIPWQMNFNAFVPWPFRRQCDTIIYIPRSESMWKFSAWISKLLRSKLKLNFSGGGKVCRCGQSNQMIRPKVDPSPVWSMRTRCERGKANKKRTNQQNIRLTDQNHQFEAKKFWSWSKMNIVCIH